MAQSYELATEKMADESAPLRRATHLPRLKCHARCVRSKNVGRLEAAGWVASGTVFATERFVKAGGNGCRVMVVDDDADNRDLVLALLEKEGFLASSAENGAEAIAQLEKGLDPDLILTDLLMPVMSGWDLCEALKSKLAWQSIPIIVLCGMSADQRGELQVDDAFEKPTDNAHLLSRIRELCGV
jgi:CheY-like chemotaxis protein